MKKHLRKIPAPENKLRRPAPENKSKRQRCLFTADTACYDYPKCRCGDFDSDKNA